jgi:hypothetical protein
MFGYENIHLNLNFPSFYLLLALLVPVGYTIFIYKYTIPNVSKIQKFILVFLRSLALLLVIFMIFEPILALSKKNITTPLNLIFLDNSRSMKFTDGAKRDSSALDFCYQILSSYKIPNKELMRFGNDINYLSEDSIKEIKFNEGSTNFENIFNSINKINSDISSITIISDGEYTTGSNPVYRAEQLGIPIFTIGIGDSSKKKDVELLRILNNDLFYVDNPTEILATIKNTGYPNQSAKIELSVDGELVDQKNITLSETGLQTEKLNFTPKSPGEKKLLINLSSLDGEFTYANNKIIKYVKVLSDKINIVLVSSSPSPDLSFIKNTIGKEDNFKISSIIETAQGKYLNVLTNSEIDSADIFCLSGFPTSSSNTDLVNKIFNRINKNKTPYFFVLSPGTDINRFLELNTQSSFSVAQISRSFREVQPELNNLNNANTYIPNSEEENVVWQNLPPAIQPVGIYQAKPESKVPVLAKINNKVTNEPLIISRNFSGSRSISVLAGNIWKWKLQTAKKDNHFFDSFIKNSIKWLNSADDIKRIAINTIKKNYSQGEPIEFVGKVFDESLNPLENAEIKVDINSGKNKYQLTLQNVSPGIYEGSININETGDFSFNAEVSSNGSQLGGDKGNFNIGEIDLEFLNPRMNYEFLNLLSQSTHGEFFLPDEFNNYEKKISSLISGSSKEKVVTSEISLWSTEWLLGLVVLLFSLEWFLRKRFGML